MSLPSIRTLPPALPGEKWWLLAIVLLGTAFRLAGVLVLHVEPVSDALAYQTMALNLLDGNGIVDNMGNRAMYNVGYPLFVLAPAFALSGRSLLGAELVNAALAVVTMYLCYAIALELGARPLGRLAAALLWACYTPAWAYGVYLAKENLLTPLMLGVVWCALRLRVEPSLRLGGGCGALLGFIALTGNAGLAVGAAPLFAVLRSRSGAAFKAGALLLMGAIALAVTAPWVVRNAHVLGTSLLNTNGGFNLYLGNNPVATGTYMSIADTPRGGEWQAMREQLGEAGASAALQRDAIQWIRQHPGEFASLAVDKAVLFWKPPLHEGEGRPQPLEKLLRIAWLIEYLVIVGVAIAGVAFAAGRSEKTLLVWLAILAYTAVHMIFYAITRYREPMMPMLCALAGLALGEVGARARTVRRAPTIRA